MSLKSYFSGFEFVNCRRIYLLQRLLCGWKNVRLQLFRRFLASKAFQFISIYFHSLNSCAIEELLARENLKAKINFSILLRQRCARQRAESEDESKSYKTFHKATMLPDHWVILEAFKWWLGSASGSDSERGAQIKLNRIIWLSLDISAARENFVF